MSPLNRKRTLRILNRKHCLRNLHRHVFACTLQIAIQIKHTARPQQACRPKQPHQTESGLRPYTAGLRCVRTTLRSHVTEQAQQVGSCADGSVQVTVCAGMDAHGSSTPAVWLCS